jgi:hypothetical protein
MGGKVYMNGNVGIGTTNPACALSFGTTTNNKILSLYDSGPSEPVSTATTFYGFGINGSTLRYQVPASNIHAWYTGATNTMSLDGGNLLVKGGTASTSTTTGALQVTGGVGIGGNLNCGTIRSSGTSNFAIGTNTGANATAITSPDVNMGIYSGTGDGSTASTFNLAIGSWNGTGFVDTYSRACYIYFDHRAGKINAATFNATSDYRIKENVKNLDDIFTVDKLRPVSFYNKIAKRNDIGFIAHEVQEVLPQLVDGEKDGENNQTLNYIGLIGILTKEIQELKKTNTDLQSKLDNVLTRLENARL